MKHIIIMITLLILFVFLISCTMKQADIISPIEEAEPVEEIRSQNIPLENITKSENISAFVPEVTEESASLELFESQLTYRDAYNGPLFATSEQIGSSAPLMHLQNLRRNGVNAMIAFFGIELDADEEVDLDIQYAQSVVKAAPGRVIPFFSPGMGGSETKLLLGDKLTTIYKDTLAVIKEQAGENFIQGLGEIEQYAWDIQPNNPKMLELFDLAAENNLKVMFHPDPGQSNAVKTVLERYPDTIFLIHMFPEDLSTDKQQYLILLKTHDNLYFSVDADHMMFDGETGLLYKYEDETVAQAKAHFMTDYDQNEQQLLNSAVQRYKPLIEAVPDKVMWGTEGGTPYFYEPEVYDRTVKFSRLFIAELDPVIQEKFAYKNALKMFGEEE